MVCNTCGNRVDSNIVDNTKNINRRYLKLENIKHLSIDDMVKLYRDGHRFRKKI